MKKDAANLSILLILRPSNFTIDFFLSIIYLLVRKIMFFSSLPFPPQTTKTNDTRNIP